eukprot:10698555-Alexandrium_andersonii.AAC.1
MSHEASPPRLTWALRSHTFVGGPGFPQSRVCSDGLSRGPRSPEARGSWPGNCRPRAGTRRRTRGPRSAPRSAPARRPRARRVRCGRP